MTATCTRTLSQWMGRLRGNPRERAPETTTPAVEPRFTVVFHTLLHHRAIVEALRVFHELNRGNVMVLARMLNPVDIPLFKTTEPALEDSLHAGRTNREPYLISHGILVELQSRLGEPSDHEPSSRRHPLSHLAGELITRFNKVLPDDDDPLALTGPTLNAQEANVVVYALSLYSRIGLGDLLEVEDIMRTGSLPITNTRISDDEAADEIHSAISQIKVILGYKEHQHYGIHYPKLSPTTQAVWEVLKLLQKEIAIARNPSPAFRGPDYDGLTIPVTRLPVPEINVVYATSGTSTTSAD